MEGAALYNILWVDKTTAVYVADGSVQYPYNSIQTAVAAAAGLLPTAANPVLVLVMPGVYDEQVTLSQDYVYLAGWDRDTTILTNVASPVLSITTQYTGIVNFTMTCTAVGASYIISATAAGAWANEVAICDCKFISSNVSMRLLLQANTRFHFRRCVMDGAGLGNPVLQSTGLSLTMSDCISDTGVMAYGGCVLTCYRCDLAFIYAASSAASFYLLDCILRDDGTIAPVFLAVVPSALVVKDCRFVNALGAGYDIQSTVAVTGAVIENNVMVRGIDPDVSHVDPIKWVGAAGNKDFYASLADALAACTFNDCTVKLLMDVVLTGNLTPPAYEITVDGNGKHAITTAGAFYISNGPSRFVLRDLIIGTVGGLYPFFYVIYVGDFFIENCIIYAIMDIPVAAGTKVYVFDSLVQTPTGSGCFQIRNASPYLTIKRSRVKPLIAAPAIYFGSGVSNNNTMIEHSTICHGSMGANDPFGRDAAQVVNFRDHHSAFNTTPGAGWATNLVAPAQRFETVDPNVDF